jgi:hypothetical protein
VCAECERTKEAALETRESAGAPGECPEAEYSGDLPLPRLGRIGLQEEAAVEPVTFEDFGRIPIPGGEVMTFSMRREDNGIQHAVHQAHLAHLAHGVSPHGGRIDRDRAWRRGRWPAALPPDMAEATRD